MSVMYGGRVVESAPVREFFKNTAHPYSQGLLNSLPSCSSLEPIEGQPPTIYEEISGCRFHPRCKKRMDICSEQNPRMYKLSDEHFCACLLYN